MAPQTCLATLQDIPIGRVKGEALAVSAYLYLSPHDVASCSWLTRESQAVPGNVIQVPGQRIALQTWRTTCPNGHTQMKYSQRSN